MASSTSSTSSTPPPTSDAPVAPPQPRVYNVGERVKLAGHLQTFKIYSAHFEEGQQQPHYEIIDEKEYEKDEAHRLLHHESTMKQTFTADELSLA